MSSFTQIASTISLVSTVFMYIMTVVSCAPASPTSSTGELKPHVVFWEDKGLAGLAFQYDVTSTECQSLAGKLNDKYSSIEMIVKDGCVAIYKDAHCRGNSLKLTQTTTDLGEFNDQISSFRVCSPEPN